MDDLRDAKTYGEIGSILSVFGIFIPYAGLLLLIAGLVLEILAVDKISHLLNTKEIFKNYLISIVVEVVGIVSTLIFGVASLVLIFASALPVSSMNSILRFRFGSLLVFLFAILLVLWVTFVISAMFLKKSFDLMASKLNVPLFSTSALLYLIGAVLTILVVGFFIVFIASILKIVAYSNIPETLTQTPSSTQS
ncbi:MAG: DUF996 domain-containing protein [Thermoproteota archaeon]|nr:DUF996 domain-containing protein [Candidatus Brockarchaeota archaeon]